MENIANKVFDKLGGASVAAEAAKVAIQTAYRWSYPKERGATGGLGKLQHLNLILYNIGNYQHG